VMALLSDVGRLGSLWEYRTLLRDRRPARQLVLQLTERCNARCPQCGMSVRNSFHRATIDVESASRIVDEAAAKNVKAISFTGGEPMLYADEVVTLACRARERGIPHVRTGTNGFLFRGSDSPGFEARTRALARALVRAGVSTFWVSMDSADPHVHEEIRGMEGVCEGIRRALPVFHEEGLFPAANVGLTRLVGRTPLNASDPETLATQARAAFGHMFEAIVDLGFTMAGMCYPMSMPVEQADATAAYRATSPSSIVRFAPAEKAVIYGVLLDVIPEARARLRLFTPRCNLDVLREENLAAASGRPGEPITAYPCRGGVDFFFIAAADGLVYPCGYRGDEPLGSIDELVIDADREPTCTACEWECFRDPSELLGPLYEVQPHPATLLRKHDVGSRRLRYWFEDVRYALACGMFDGRVAPDYRRLACYGRSRTSATGATLGELDRVEFPDTDCVAADAAALLGGANGDTAVETATIAEAATAAS